MSNKLKEVTYLTVKDLKKQDIILPGTYSSTFEGIANKLDVSLDNDNIILKDLQQDIDHVDVIVKKTNENLNTLHKSTCDAQKAIKNKDEKSLETINNELLKMQKQIDFLQIELFSDPLTGAYNRKWFSDYYLKEDNFQTDGYIAFIDLNNFKIINDSYGHIVGDQVLKYLVKFLKIELDYPGVNVVRYAGDEFIVLFDKEDTGSLNINKTMLDTQKKLSIQKLKSSKIKELSFSFSYGLLNFKSGQEIEYVLEIVDELMYKNKIDNR